MTISPSPSPKSAAKTTGPSPGPPQQAKFASARDSVRILKGHPGSGQTTALLHAADQTTSTNILYLTYSSDLAVRARSYFERYCSSSRQYHVNTFPTFLRDLLGVAPAPVPLAEQRSRFRVEAAPLARTLGPWAVLTFTSATLGMGPTVQQEPLHLWIGCAPYQICRPLPLLQRATHAICAPLSHNEDRRAR